MGQYSKNTTPQYKLPRNIYYFSNSQTGKIQSFKAYSLSKLTNKSFNINKYTLSIAYKKAIEYIYGKDKVKDILLEYPEPIIDKEDLHILKRKNKTGVHGIILFFSNQDNPLVNSYLSAFILYNPNTRKTKAISIRKYGLEEAWKRAVEFRYSNFDPLPTDDTTLKPEWWDMINPLYRTKTR